MVDIKLVINTSKEVKTATALYEVSIALSVASEKFVECGDYINGKSLAEEADRYRIEADKILNRTTAIYEMLNKIYYQTN